MLDKKVYIIKISKPKSKIMNSNWFTNFEKWKEGDTLLGFFPPSRFLYVRNDCESDCVIVQTSIRGKKGLIVRSPFCALRLFQSSKVAATRDDFIWHTCDECVT